MIFPKVAALSLAVQLIKVNGSDVDCSQETNKKAPECICRLQNNWGLDVCQKFLENDFQSNIINGEEVPPNVYPWFARSTLGSGWGGCGGSLISSEYVLTAAHCVEGRVNTLLSNGGYQIGALCSPYGPNDTDNCQQEVESFGISSIDMHPSYNPGTLQHDLALVRLDGTSTITPVPIDLGDVSPGYEDLSLKQNLWPIGFGTTETGSVTSKLMHVNVNYVKQSTCNSAYSGDITNDMMCAADTNQDSCQGDSGGPLYDSDNEVLVGVVSWGYGCALAQYPGVYSRISNQISWIKEKVCAEHGAPKPGFCITGPTPSPSPPPPTPAPTPCGGSIVKVEVNTDNYPQETSWSLVNKCTDQTVFSVSQGQYTSAGETYSEEICVPSNAEYSFTISDSYGDGICCGYGTGSYTVALAGENVASGGEFGGSEETSFGSCNASPTTPSPTKSPTESPTAAPTKSPTDTPTKSPTSAPTKSPTAPPVSNDCSNGKVLFELDLKTDNYPGETTWELENSSGEQVLSGGPYTERATDHNINECVDPDLYTFTIKDSWGDGICCGYGSGSYSVKYDGNTAKEGGSFGSSESTTFGEAPSMKMFKLTLKTDNYPAETTWDLVNTCNNERITGGPYSERMTEYIKEEELSPAKYRFTISDSWGDGICCGYGSGSYKVEYDGDIKKEGGQFTSSEVTTFGECPPDPASAASNNYKPKPPRSLSEKKPEYTKKEAQPVKLKSGLRGPSK